MQKKPIAATESAMRTRRSTRILSIDGRPMRLSTNAAATNANTVSGRPNSFVPLPRTVHVRDQEQGGQSHRRDQVARRQDGQEQQRREQPDDEPHVVLVEKVADHAVRMDDHPTGDGERVRAVGPERAGRDETGAAEARFEDEHGDDRPAEAEHDDQRAGRTVAEDEDEHADAGDDEAELRAPDRACARLHRKKYPHCLRSAV